MTDIEWGAEIAVNGVRPEWLRDKDKFRWFGPGMSQDWYDQYLSPNDGTSGAMFCKGAWPKVTAIRLPATHPYYLATSRGFTYWPGGESAPKDWDGGDCLDCDGDMLSARNVWDSDWPSQTVIGYRKRIEQPAPAIAPELVERMVALVKKMAPIVVLANTSVSECYAESRAILAELEPDPDLTLAKSIVGDAEAIALAIKAARENGRG